MTMNSSNTMNNLSTTATPKDVEGTTKLMSYFITAVCFVSVVVGLTGNFTIVIVRIFKQVQRKNTTAYTFLVCQLAIADLIFAFTIIFDIHVNMHGDKWMFGHDGCRFIKTVQSASLTTTVGFLTMMAYERYCGISKPLHHRWSIKKTALLVLALWIYVFLSFIPFVTALGIKDEECSEIHHPSENFRKAYTLFLFITNYIVPLLCVIVFHTLIVIRMKKHFKSMRDQRHRASSSSEIKRKIKNNIKHNERQISTTSTYSVSAVDAVCGEGETNCWVALYKFVRNRLSKRYVPGSKNNYKTAPTTPSPNIRSRRRSNIFRRLINRSKTNEDRKLIQMLVAVTLSFALMTLPTQIWYIWNDFRSKQHDDPSSVALRIVEVFSSLVYLHCCSNCVIYSAMDKRFRTDVQKTFQYIFNCTPKKRFRQSFQRFTIVSRVSRGSRNSSSTSVTKKSSSKSTTSQQCDSPVTPKQKRDLKKEEDDVFILERETVIL